MISNILDTITNQATENGWVVKYVALSPELMKQLVGEVIQVTGVQVSSISQYKDMTLAIKEIVGFQVSYELPF